MNNSIAPKKVLPDKPIEYQVNGETINLSPSIVRNFLTNGDGNVSDQEVAYFLNLCKYQKLNPLIKECYLIKYSNKSPATMVIGKDALLKRARRNDKYKGHEAGVIVRDKESGKLEQRTGAFVLPNEELIAGWARVYVSGDAVPNEVVASMREYGQQNAMWAGKPCTMIRKVALAQCLRESFPEDLGGMYSSEEVGAEEPDAAPVIIDPQPEPEAQPVPMEPEDYSQIPPDFEQPPVEDLADF